MFSLAFYVCFWNWGLVCWQVVCVRMGVRGWGGQWPFWDRHKIRIWVRQRERGPLSCDSAFHQGTGRQRHKTRHVSPLRHPPTTTTTSTPALPSVPSLHPSPVSVTLTFIKKPHAGIPFQHLCVDARFQHVHVHIYTHTSLWGHCMDLTWLSLFKMTSDKLHFAIKKKTFFTDMKPSLAWNFCHRDPR